MRKLITAILLLTCATSLRAEEVVLLDGTIRLSIPSGFTRLTQDEITSKFPRNNRPPFAAFSDARRNATIAFTLSKQQQPLSEEKLPELKAAFEQLFPRVLPGLRWNDRSIVSLNGRRWVFFDLTAHAVDSDVRNNMYFTAHRGDVLGINAVSTVSEWPKVEERLKQSIKTVKLSEPTPNSSSQRTR